MNVTTLWYWAQNAAKTKKAVDVIVVGASGTIVKLPCNRNDCRNSDFAISSEMTTFNVNLYKP